MLAVLVRIGPGSYCPPARVPWCPERLDRLDKEPARINVNELMRPIKSSRRDKANQAKKHGKAKEVVSLRELTELIGQITPASGY